MKLTREEFPEFETMTVGEFIDLAEKNKCVLTVLPDKSWTIDELLRMTFGPNWKETTSKPKTKSNPKSTLADVDKDVADRTKRNKRILEMSKKGYSQKEIAKQVGLHYTTVYSIIRKSKEK